MINRLDGARRQIYLVAIIALFSIGGLAGPEPLRIYAAYSITLPVAVFLASACAGALAISYRSLCLSVRGGMLMTLFSPAILYFWARVAGSEVVYPLTSVLIMMTWGILAAPAGLVSGHLFARATGLWQKMLPLLIDKKQRLQ